MKKPASLWCLFKIINFPVSSCKSRIKQKLLPSELYKRNFCVVCLFDVKAIHTSKQETEGKQFFFSFPVSCKPFQNLFPFKIYPAYFIFFFSSVQSFVNLPPVPTRSSITVLSWRCNSPICKCFWKSLSWQDGFGPCEGPKLIRELPGIRQVSQLWAAGFCDCQWQMLGIQDYNFYLQFRVISIL